MELEKIIKKSKKRLGRGHGSGKVKTSGRGQKGQKARGTIPVGFEGGQLSLMKRLPLLRGKAKNKSHQVRVAPLSIAKLGDVPEGSQITLALLKKHTLIGDNVMRVKLLGSEKISHAYTVKVAYSQSAKAAIEKAGGTVQ
ncbi:50S ribosomal protein L15 [Candidatus Gottesmanbacteria bacterium RIFCSPHIGHO2_01_FULL_46_14]|uniref:Large ribosomal subunit protein uL15 n=3 Tax=Candidatus Gottesmaniibacteriota TaxID=1752720 RepID=A0A1F5ZS12_9BACT|nr:MAG: 50S ribosomal protein L15 [Candidatus Gottesmanbacteria bacterium GW2011_GWA1_47_8]OGG15238.1 MAG: 50S ribosomal protein L15 [Candidatus Gottesmanbacteria bacterium RIFCSPHIGHO2_01_FULL_46_14]OGG28651.1 MAG: 50S ribosomal protein L15 [Candidatus Gottesmanbacteria bacterium RIFCSPLOWO2_01_FULL_46_21]